MKFDLFISHASEDKVSCARPLAKRLSALGANVWYDEINLEPGDSLRAMIDRGLIESRCWVVVLSDAFFAKKPWTEYELSSLIQLNMGDKERRIIPVWHKVGRDKVLSFSPHLADTIALNTDKGIKHLADELIKILRPLAPPFQVFPRSHVVSIGGAPDLLTWVGSGENDTIEGACVPNPFGDSMIRVLPIINSRQGPVLQIKFKHRVSGVINPRESWWSAIVGFAPGEGRRWAHLDLRKYEQVIIEARAFTTPNKVGFPLRVTVPLCIRFEDDSTDAPKGGFHQSSSWCHPPIGATENFHTFERLLFRDFDWEVGAWHWTTRPPDLSNILQLVIGHDASVPDCEGFIEIISIVLK